MAARADAKGPPASFKLMPSTKLPTVKAFTTRDAADSSTKTIDRLWQPDISRRRPSSDERGACSRDGHLLILDPPAMDILWEELTGGLTPDHRLLRVSFRLLAAIVLGGSMGLQRMNASKPSGLRTHILVCLGTTVILLSSSGAAISLEGASRIVQGIVTGIGFIGAGSILKLSQDHMVHGLLVSARIWTTAAVGIAIGLGQVGIALITSILIVLILGLVAALGRRFENYRRS